MPVLSLLSLCFEKGTLYTTHGMVSASLLATQEQNVWDIWIAPASFPSDATALVRQVLDEVHVPLLSFPQTAEPSFDRSWDEGVVLCSGATDQ